MNGFPVARIRWLSFAEGGRERPPSGPSYSAVARFEEQGELWTHDAWSLVLEFKTTVDDRLCHLAEVRFLAESGPSGWLTEGSRFELMEGSKVVAKGEVVKRGRA